MRWYLNDLSLDGQFPTASEFLNALSRLLRLRIKSPVIRDGLFCSRMFSQCRATPERTCSDAAATHASREEKRLILAWMTRQGPFIEDDRLQEPNDYFEFKSIDVTDQGLGEAARRIAGAQKVAVFSFVGGPINFELTPLPVQQGLAEEPIALLSVPNIWDVQDLLNSAMESVAEPNSWPELIEAINLRFNRLLVSDAVLNHLNEHPFYPVVARRALELSTVLQEYMEGRQLDGKVSARSMELYRQFFMGERARFSDESEANKRNFEHELTFPDPESNSKVIFGPWHGKIQTPQFRVHFEWPVPPQQARLKILYIGPKITKM